jgi:activator of HSP90 ATPase
MVQNAAAGSIWNSNSWHWEDKNYTQTSHAFLKEHLPKVALKKDDFEIKLYDVKEIKGDSQVTIRKKKSIFLYEFDIDIYFKATRRDGEGDNKVQGQVHMKEIN